GGEARRSTAPGWRHPWRKAHCAGVGLGGRGPGSTSLYLFIQPRTDGSLCRMREGKGLNGNRWGLSKSAPPPNTALTQHSGLCLSPGASKSGLKSRTGGGGVGEEVGVSH
ncbi:Hypothetical predicted protein, partial [Marmota monax]